jgi:hypothetical protein
LNETLIKAIIVVNFALLFYSIAIITEQRKSRISGMVLIFLTAAVCLDISSTVLMIIGSSKIPITVHGFLGYTALLAMLIDTVLIWRFWTRNKNAKVSSALNIYTRIAYSWWIIAYIAGAIIALIL